MNTHFFLNTILLLLSLFTLATSVSNPSSSSSTPTNLLLPPDASALLSFKSKADLHNKLPFFPNTTFNFCKWQGLKCFQTKVVRLIIHGLKLSGIFSPNSLTRLDQLRVLSLQNNSLTGSIPDLSGLLNLKALFLDHNSFSSSIPPSISILHRIRTIDFSYNNLSGAIPLSLTNLDRLFCLRLEYNRLNGSIPQLNQSSLQIFNVSKNELNGAIPVTQVLLRLDISSFSSNPELCGEIIHKECRPMPPFFGPSNSSGSDSVSVSTPPPGTVVGPSQLSQQGTKLSQRNRTKPKQTAMIIGFSAGGFILIGSIFCFVMSTNKLVKSKNKTSMALDSMDTANAEAVIRMEETNELEEKVKKVQEDMQIGKSGSLVFCAGETQVYTLDQLMRGSAEMLGKGSIGTTYKAVLDNRLIVCVKRLDGGKMVGIGKEEFERHMESVGGLRHPNLVPLRAYFQAKEERLLVYDYEPNGSLFSLIHGSKSARAKPLHWTSCLKIAEDVAQGLSYVHQAWRLIHGNLKSTNILLGSDFEACLTDYCLSVLTTTSDDHPDSTAYKAPETQKSINHTTSKSDVYSYGVLLLELLTGKPPSEHLVLSPDDMINWVRSSREDYDGGDDERLGMILEVAIACSAMSPEQRPTMWQVLKMIQEIKEAVVMDGG